MAKNLNYKALTSASGAATSTPKVSENNVNTTGAVTGILAGLKGIQNALATKNAQQTAVKGAATGAITKIPDVIYSTGGTTQTTTGPNPATLGSHFNPDNYNSGHIESDLTAKTYNNSASAPAAAQAQAYDPTQDLLNAYNARQQAMEDNYQAALDQLRNSYNASVNDLRSQGDDALRQAYINMMMNKRGLNQQLEAAGLTGGATESAMANLYNTYANDRNEIARALNQRLTQVGNNYGNNVSNLGMNYNNNVADAMADYQNQLATARQSLANSLAKTTANSTGYRTKAYVPTEEETLATETPTTNAVRNMAGMTPMQAYAYVSGRADLTNEEKAEALQLAGYSIDMIRQMLAEQNSATGSTAGSATGATSGASLGGATNGAISGAATGALGGVNNAATNAAVQGALTGLAGILGLNR